MERKKIVGIIMMLLLLWTTGCSTGENEATENGSDTPATKINTELNVVYETISPDWLLYDSVDELIDASDKVILGTVTNVSFQMIDIRTGKAPEGEVEESYCYLYTIYDIDTIETYKGEPSQKEQVRVIGGIKGAYEPEQVAALGGQEQTTIFTLGDSARLDEGVTYLFMLAQYDDAIPTIVNIEQGFYDIADVQNNGTEQDGDITVQDIISSFGQNEWIEFKSVAEELSE